MAVGQFAIAAPCIPILSNPEPGARVFAAWWIISAALCLNVFTFFSGWAKHSPDNELKARRRRPIAVFLLSGAGSGTYEAVTAISRIAKERSPSYPSGFVRYARITTWLNRMWFAMTLALVVSYFAMLMFHVLPAKRGHAARPDAPADIRVAAGGSRAATELFLLAASLQEAESTR